MDTRLHLIATAEKLFAQRGFEAVSMREINRAAGQGNASALHYHFGSREALVEAIIAWRMSPVNQRRNEILDGMVKDGREITPRELAQALVVPLSEVAAIPVEENGWLSFLGQIYASGTIDLPEMTRRIGSGSSLRRLEKLARAALPEIPSPILDQRVAILIRQAVHALAEWQRSSPERPYGDQMRSLSLFAANLTDMTAAALAVLPGDVTLQAHAASGRVRRLAPAS